MGGCCCLCQLGITYLLQDPILSLSVTSVLPVLTSGADTALHDMVHELKGYLPSLI